MKAALIWGSANAVLWVLVLLISLSLLMSASARHVPASWEQVSYYVLVPLGAVVLAVGQIVCAWRRAPVMSHVAWQLPITLAFYPYLFGYTGGM